MVLVCGKPHNCVYANRSHQQLPILSTSFVDSGAFKINALHSYTQQQAKIWKTVQLVVSFSPQMLAGVYKTGVTHTETTKNARCG